MTTTSSPYPIFAVLTESSRFEAFKYVFMDARRTAQVAQVHAQVARFVCASWEVERR